MSVPPAVHRTVLVVDVSAFGDRRRTNLDQLTVRRGLYEALRQAFGEAGVSWDDCDREDRGDGVLVVIPSTVAKGLLVEKLPDRLVAALRAYNAGRPETECMRLRLSLHAGEIHYDEHGVAGRAVNLAFRLLDAAAFKQAHDRSAGLLAVITSQWFFDEVVWHSVDAERDTYRRIRVVAKETDTEAWIRLVDAEPGVRAEAAPPAVAPVLHQLPPSTRQFVGREAELAGLTRLIDARGSATLVVATIDGMAGIGKTALALTWAHRVRDQFPDGQLHVNLRGFDEHEPMDADQALHGFLQALGVSAQAIPADVDAKGALYRSLLAERRMLIVLDNARSSEHVRPLLPGDSTCAVVITSRNRMDSLLVRDGAHRIALGVLPDADAFALLAERVDSVRVEAEPDAAAELVGLCVHLPMALSVAAARAASQPALSLGGLVQELRDEHRRLDVLDLGDTDLSLRAVFSWSYAVLGIEAARLFRLLGIHPGADICPAACRALAGDQAPAALRELTGAHLVAEYLPGRFRFHDLLRAYAAELAGTDTDTERHAAAIRLVEHYLGTALLADRLIQPHRYGRDDLGAVVRSANLAVNGYDAAIAWFTAEHLTLEALVGFAAEHGLADCAWRLAWASTTFLRRTGRWSERVAILRIALAAVRASGDCVGEAVTSRHLATALARLGQFEEAIDLLDRSAEIYRARHDSGGAFKNHLAYTRVFDARRDHHDAFNHARTAWELIRDSDDELGRADALNAMGRQLCLLARHDHAQPLCARALELYKAIGHREGEADVLLNLGDIERAMGHNASAAKYYEISLDIDRRLGDRYWEAVSLERLAYALKGTGDVHATATLREALDVYREIGHPDAHRVHARLMSA
ncbi:MAG TPA: tetratricopeptide repeat protein [Actinophytocola sp.]|jgi:tetratricopeptide (TPR) repeat protein|nr:tetratricopeptide repeat protein [Actinophytocola sp.]